MLARKPWLEQLRKRLIVDPIRNDKRSTTNTLLGHDFGWVRRVGINGGQADFDSPLNGLSPRDRAMLYAYVNQKGHVDELIHAFNKLGENVRDFQNSTIIDIGCGPFTAGLALANVIGNEVPYRYYGLDRAQSMLDFGRELALGVSAAGEFHPSTKVFFESDLDSINFGPLRAADMTIFVLSYLLASGTIDIEKLVGEMLRACNRISLGRVVVFYTNSVREEARINYEPFRSRLTSEGFDVFVEGAEVFNDADNQRNIHYALFVRKPQPLSSRLF